MAQSLKKAELDSLIREAQAGCHKAFQKIVEDFRDRVVSVLTRMLNDEDLAKDCYQQACQKLVTHISSYNFEYQFSTWFYTINLNFARNHLRDQKRYPHESIDGHLDLPSRATWDPQASQKTIIIQKAIKALPAKYREAYVLRQLHNWEYAEIANILNVPLGTTKSRIYRAQQMVKAFIQQRYPKVCA